MASIRITGGAPLDGEVWISGAKNAVLPILVASLLVPLLALIILIASGTLPAFSASLQGSLVEMAPYVANFRLLNLLWAVGWIIQLMGLGLLAL